MDDYQEIYEETNNYIEDQRPEERYQYQPEYRLVREYYPNQKPLIYEKSRYITREIPPKNNAQMRTRTEQYYNYYTESNLPYNENSQNFEQSNQNTNKRYNTPDRISNAYNLNNGKNNLNNIRDLYSNPSNNRVNIRKRVYKGSQTPQPYNIPIPNNNYNNNQDQEFIDNYQYHETKNIKNKGIKKYESITHITGYSNLIPLNRMKNLYGNNYNYNNNNMIKQKLNSYSEQNFGIDKLRKERLLQERLKREEEIRLEKVRQERKRQEEELRFEKMRKEELKQERLRLEKERIRQEKENNKKRYNNKDNINRHEVIKKTKITKYNKIPVKSNYNSLSYNRNYSYQNMATSGKSNNSIINKLNEYKYLNNRKKNKYNDSIRTKTTKITTNIKNNSYGRKNNRYNLEEKNYRDYNSNSNLNKNKLISLMKVQQKTASLNFPNQNKKVDTYGENFDERKYKREYINVENVDDGKIENHVETGISKDGQYLISVTSARKIFDENMNNQNEYYENENEYENDEREEGEGLYEKKEEINEEEDNVYELPLPEKNEEEIISTVTTKRKNLGDNYQFYESKNLNKPNISSVTKHKRRTERTIFGNEEHETREVKTYKLRPELNEYGQIIGTSKIPYDEEGEEEYIEGEEEYNDEGEGEEPEGEEDMEEEAYYQ